MGGGQSRHVCACFLQKARVSNTSRESVSFPKGRSRKSQCCRRKDLDPQLLRNVPQQMGMLQARVHNCFVVNGKWSSPRRELKSGLQVTGRPSTPEVRYSLAFLVHSYMDFSSHDVLWRIHSAPVVFSAAVPPECSREGAQNRSQFAQSLCRAQRRQQGA